MFNNGGANKIQESPKGFYHIVVNMNRTTTFVWYVNHNKLFAALTKCNGHYVINLICIVITDNHIEKFNY